MKKLLSIFLSVSLIGFSNLSAVETVVEDCVVTSTEKFFPVGDERGVKVLTKTESNRDCNITKTIQGACIEWEQRIDKYTIKPTDYNVYRSNNNEGSVGSLFGMAGAYDQLEHLWSGWKGYCEEGTKTNFDWATDPMYWGMLAMSTALDYASAGTGASSVASNATEEAAKTGLEKSLEAGLEAAKTAIQEMALQVGMKIGPAAAGCILSAGINMAGAAYDYLRPADEVPCDPVDEFCTKAAEATEESDAITMDRQDYEDIIEANPEYAEYIIILDEEDGILTVRYKKPGEIDGAENLNLEQTKELEAKMKKIMLAVDTALVALKMATCIGTSAFAGGTIIEGAGGGLNTNADHGGSPTSVANVASSAVGMVPSSIMGPYGPLIKAGMQVAIDIATSFESIDSCGNNKDAIAQGTRHEKTQEALEYNLCHHVDTFCAEKGLFGGCALDAYDYCCYDQLLTKILVEQMKAQLGRDWAHCTGISLRDINFVSFRQCEDAEMSNGFDGSKRVGYYDPMQSFQYKNKCIDLTEFKEYLKAQMGEDIDMTDFDNLFNDIKTQNK